MTKRALPLVAAFALSLLPLAAAAQGCDHEKVEMSCKAGSVWDAEKGVCVPQTS